MDEEQSLNAKLDDANEDDALGFREAPQNLAT